MATYSRHHANYATPTKTLPITMPSKAPAYPYPVSRVAISPPEYSDSSSAGSRHGSGTSAGSYSIRSSASGRSSNSGSSNGGSDYDKYDVDSRYGGSVRGRERVDVDPVEMLTERMDKISDFSKMDRSMARQAQDSGRINAANTELAELQALAQRRLKTARVNFAQGVEDAREARRDIEYCQKRTEAMKVKAERKHPVEYGHAKAKTRSRHV